MSRREYHRAYYWRNVSVRRAQARTAARKRRANRKRSERQTLYPWPSQVGDSVLILTPNRHAVMAGASKFANHRGWVYRTRWNGIGVLVRRAA